MPRGHPWGRACPTARGGHGLRGTSRSRAPRASGSPRESLQDDGGQTGACQGLTVLKSPSHLRPPVDESPSPLGAAQAAGGLAPRPGARAVLASSRLFAQLPLFVL